MNTIWDMGFDAYVRLALEVWYFPYKIIGQNND